MGVFDVHLQGWLQVGKVWPVAGQIWPVVYLGRPIRYWRSSMKRTIVAILAALALVFGLSAPASASTFLYNARCSTMNRHLFAGTDVYQSTAGGRLHHWTKPSARLHWKENRRRGPDVHWKFDHVTFDGKKRRNVIPTYYKWRPSAKRHYIKIWWKGSQILTFPQWRHCTIKVY